GVVTGYCKDNVIWRTGVVLFVGLNQPGSNNDHARTSGNNAAGAEAEYALRNSANVAWVKKAFSLARADSTILGIMILSQANPFERFLESGQGYATSGDRGFIAGWRTDMRVNARASRAVTP